MLDYQKFYIDGRWQHYPQRRCLDIINPATESSVAKICLAETEDIDLAVDAARSAFPFYSQTSKQQRLELLHNIIEQYQLRYTDLVDAVCSELGAPISLAQAAQVGSGLKHLRTCAQVLNEYSFSNQLGATHIEKEAIGVCGLITPWNWPLNQMICKVAPALAAGCTIVLKPSELAPISAYIFTQIIEQAGVPAGVFNLINGEGHRAGAYMAAHPGIDMISFTGSTQAGVKVAQAAAGSVKRVCQELGGKSANIILADANLEQAVSAGVIKCFTNSGQSCNAPSRMLVPAEYHEQAIDIARRVAGTIVVGKPCQSETSMGPVISASQYQKIQQYIQTGVEQGAQLVCGGMGKPTGLETGYYVKPTIFANVLPQQTISQEEIFGPVLCIIPYLNEQQAIDIANDSKFGLACYISSNNPNKAREIAKNIRVGMVYINSTPIDFSAPFGGYKQSGNGREWGRYGLEEFLETKAIMG